jgi:hypothetical protein
MRCARVDRFRLLQASAAERTDGHRQLAARDQRVAVGRALLLVRALTAFYVGLADSRSPRF